MAPESAIISPMTLLRIPTIALRVALIGSMLAGGRMECPANGALHHATQHSVAGCHDGSSGGDHSTTMPHPSQGADHRCAVSHTCTVDFSFGQQSIHTTAFNTVAAADSLHDDLLLLDAPVPPTPPPRA